MPHINDLKRDALLVLTGELAGHISDLEKLWLMTELSVSEPQNINDLWNAYLEAQGATPGHTGDMMVEWLEGLGYAGSLSDMLYQMWAAGGPALPSSPFDGVMRADFESSVDLTVGGGSLTGTTSGGVSVHDGLVDMSGGSSGYVEYDPVDNMQPVDTMAVNVLYIPNYTTTPPATQVPWFWGRNADTRNGMWLQHNTDGSLVPWIRTKSHGYINSASLGVWNPTAGQTYEIELNMDLVSGATRLFIDGTQFGSTITGTGFFTVPDTGFTQLCRIGAHSNPGSVISKFSMADFKVYDTIQHTADY